MLVQTRQQTYTPQEYRLLEETAEFRSEYHDGEIVPMTGGTINHNRIIGNIYAYLKSALRGKNAEPFMSDLRLWIPQYSRGTYPDIMVISGNPIFTEGGVDEVLNPVLIVEVLSKSTQEFDRNEKFRLYRSLPDFSEYLLVDQYQILVQQYIKTDLRQWLFQEWETETDSISLTSLGVEFSLADIYEGVQFASLTDSRS
jgi:Uma2 family endonuclease